MLEYKRLKRDRRKFLALTGLTLKEFNSLLPAFTEEDLRKYASHKTLAGKKRKRQVGGGRRAKLDTPEQKLLFILVYQKAYPLQVVMGELFGSHHSAANRWIHRLLPVLRHALAALGVMPERDGQKFAQTERDQAAAADYIIDGTERRRQRPTSPEKQGLHYSGKKKMQSDKNVVILHTGSQRVAYLSPTHAGKTQDKKVADQEQIAYPRQAVLHKDTGFQGYEPNVKQTHQPKKKPRGKELTRAEKRHNRALSRVRVREEHNLVVEHAIGGIKRARCVKDTLRNTRAECSDRFMETATGLHNLRVFHRKRALRR